MKLDFEIAVDHQTRARDQDFEEVPDYGWDSRAHILSIFGSSLPNHLKATGSNYMFLICFVSQGVEHDAKTASKMLFLVEVMIF